LLDPNNTPLRSQWRNEHELWIGAANTWCLAFDNLSYIDANASDALCRIATGGGFVARALYTDEEEVQFKACRPIMLNGIGELASRGDLLSRALVVRLPVIDDAMREPEADLWKRFEEQRPLILGALLDAVSSSLKNLPHTRLDWYPRMADFAAWVTAAECGLGWEARRFASVYRRNLEAGHEIALEASPVAQALLDLMRNRSVWRGTATELLNELAKLATTGGSSRSGWPANGKSLSTTLDRLAPNLRACGIMYERLKESGSGSRRLLQITSSVASPRDARDARDAGTPAVWLPQPAPHQEFAGDSGSSRFIAHGVSSSDLRNRSVAPVRDACDAASLSQSMLHEGNGVEDDLTF
jgi:hypothetical protein